MRWPLALAILATTLFSVEVNSQEIGIGHLETKDDPDAISSWVFLHCNRNGNLAGLSVAMEQAAPAASHSGKVPRGPIS
jgi:hypothetical protein